MATYALGEMVYKITGDSSGFNKSINQAESGISSFAGTIKTILISGALAALSKSFITAASNAEETANKFGVVFSGLTTQANEAAEALTKGFGLSTQEAKELLSTTGNILQSMGQTKSASLATSEAITKLAADYVSFTNYSGGVSGATDAIVKAMNGEREALKGLGIAINETDMKAFAEANGLVWENLDKSAKAMLTFEAITARSANVVGDFARSSNSFANQSRVLQGRLDDLKVTLGNELLPVATSAVSGFSDLVGTFNDLDESTQQNIIQVGALAASWVGLLVSLPKIGGAFSSLATSIQASATALNITKAGLLAIFVIIAGVLLKLSQANEERQKLINETVDGADYAKKETYTKAQKTIKEEGQKLADELAYNNKQIANQIKLRDQIYSGKFATAEKAPGFLDKSVFDAKIAQYEKANVKLQDKIRQLRTNALEILKGEEERRKGLTATGGNTGSTQAEKDVEALIELSKQYGVVGDAGKKAGEKIKETWDTMTFEDKVGQINNVASAFSGAISNLLSSVAGLYAAQNQAALDSLELQRQAALEAADVAEETAVEKAQKELNAAKEKGDAQVIQEKEDALKRAKINEDFDKKKRKLEYEGSLAAWEIQRAQAAISLAMAPLQAYAAVVGTPFVGPYIAPVMAAAATVAAGLGYAAVVAAKPQAPKFADGGIVPGSQLTGDRVNARLNSREMVLNMDQQKNLFDIANGGAGGGQPIYLTVQVGAEKLYETLFNATKRGELLISQGAVVAR